MEPTNPVRGAPLPTSRFSVILVEPQYRDNVGYVARSMLNFGVGELILVNAPPVDEMSRTRAVHAQDVLTQAIHYDTLAEANKHFDHLVGFAARVSSLDKAHLRMGESLEQVARRSETLGGRVGLVFGREDFGLSNEDVEACDILCTIPTSPSYRSMNLSHAVTVALYEFSRAEHTQAPYVSMATKEDRRHLFAAWYQLSGVLGFQPHRRRQALQMIRRVIGRSGLTAWEYHRFMGLLSRSLKTRGSWPIMLDDVPIDIALPEDEDDDVVPDRDAN